MKHNAGGGAECAEEALYTWLHAKYVPPAEPQPPPPFDEPPPMRAEYPHGNEGRAQYHVARAEWYRKITRGKELTGDLAEQNELFDKIARRYREYTDSRRKRKERARSPPECFYDNE